ncbi:MAG: class I poly(R)-hydroxyalkanoic acid synthase [Rickettsiales bacterium]|nr:MAG: class I poly(R)-hydroxyalkanoic acid synthase [Rickettsiales bacterium]
MDKISNDELLENLGKASAYYQEILQYILNNKSAEASFKYIDNKRNQEMVAKMAEQFLEHPDKFINLNMEYVSNFQNLISDSLSKFTGSDKQEQSSQGSATDEKGAQEKASQTKDKYDKRFQDPAWTENVYFDFIKQYYLITSDWMRKNVKQYDLDVNSKRYIEFATQHFIDALSPSNFAFTNPEVLKESLDSRLENIVNGMSNFLKDIKKQGNLFDISTTDRSFFRVGKNLAATSGKVIYQNDLIQLICYEPKEKTRSIPVFIVPPWINKYYILDLSEKNSMVKWLVDNNFQVFLVSWVNPKKKLSGKDFEDYLKEGILDPYEQIKKLGFEKINAVGYCIGGTLLAAALSYLKENNKQYINSATFLTTLLDFANPGEIGALINQDSLAEIEKTVNAKGYLDGKYLSNSFSLIRANDLVWSFFVNNYLLGKAPTAFDILYWNADSSNLPAKMYIYYLRNMYIENNLVKPNALEMLGTKIDLSKIDTPSFWLAAQADHIALWKSVYDSHQHIGGEKIFCLTEAGHVAGVVNPEGNKKYSYMLGKDVGKDGVQNNWKDAEEWQKNATNHKGSWWKSWKKWLTQNSGKLVSSIDYEKLDSIQKAPGNYVKKYNH